MKTLRLGDIAEIVSGSSAPKDGLFNEHEGLPFIRAGHLQDLCNGKSLSDIPKIIEYNANKLVQVPKGTILFAKSGMSCMKGRVYKTENKAYIVNHLAGVICSEKVNPDYLKYYFKYYKPNRLVLDSSYPSIRISDIANMKVTIPILEKQMNIARILDKSQELIDKRKVQIEDLDELVKSKFIEMFGDPITNPKGFEVKNLSEIAEYFIGLTYKPDDVSDEGTLVLRSGNIQNSTLVFNDNVRVTTKVREKLFVKENDILMCSRNGSARLVGKVAMIPKLNEEITFGAFMTIVRSANYSYLFTYFQLEAFRKQLQSSKTTTINQITKKMLDEIKLPIPPIELQNQFADFVKQVNKLKSEMEESLKELEDNFNSLMQRAFK